MTKWGSKQNRSVYRSLFPSDNKYWCNDLGSDPKRGIYYAMFKVLVLHNQVFFPELMKQNHIYHVTGHLGHKLLLQDKECMVPILLLRYTKHWTMKGGPDIGKKKSGTREHCAIITINRIHLENLSAIKIWKFIEHDVYGHKRIVDYTVDRPFKDAIPVSLLGHWMPMYQFVAMRL